MEQNNQPYVFCTDGLKFREEVKGDVTEYFIEGFISTTDPDLYNDIVTETCIDDMVFQIKGRKIKLDIEHEAMRGETMFDKAVNKTIIPIGVIVDAVKKDNGAYVKAKLNNAHTRFDEIWQSIKNGFIDGFSIAYLPVRVMTKTKEGIFYRLLDKVKLLNVALTGNPVNISASMVKVFTKSLEDFEDCEQLAPLEIVDADAIEVKDINTSKNNVMADETKPNDDKKPEDEEKSQTNARLKGLEEGMASMKSMMEVMSKSIESLTKSKSEDGEDGEDEDEDEVKSMKKELKSVKAELKALKEAPELKSVLDAPKNVETKSATLNPLDLC